MSAIFEDIRYAVRTLRKSPGSTAAALLTLCLSIGAGTAIFSVAYAMLLRPLPYAKPDRLVRVWAINPEKGIDVAYQRKTADSMSPAEFHDWRESGVFESMVGYWAFIGPQTDLENPPEVFTFAVSEGFFDLLGVQPILGRGFLPEEEQATENPVIVIQHDLWQGRFSGDPEIIDRTIEINEDPYTIVGVMPPGFVFANRRLNGFVPLVWVDRLRENRGFRNVKVIARLKEDSTLDETRAAGDVFAANLAEDHPKESGGWEVALVPIAEDTAGETYPAMRALLLAIGLVLLIACSNIANLLLVRAAGRSKEIVVRAALGASRWRLARQMLAESMLVSLAGGALGLLLASGLIKGIRAMSPSQHSFASKIIQADTVQLDLTVAAFSFGCALVAGVLFGLIPALRSSKPDLLSGLKDSGRGTAGGRSVRRLQDTLVVVQVALAVAMVVGGTLLAASFERLHRRGPGIRAEGVLSIFVGVPTSKLWDELDESGIDRDEQWTRVRAYLLERQRGIVRRLAALPGVESVATANRVLYEGWYIKRPFAIEGRAPGLDDTQSPVAFWKAVSPDYFRTVGVPLQSGRFLRPGEEGGVLVDQELATKWFPDGDAVGRRVRRFAGDDLSRIVGVVGDVREAGLYHEAPPIIYAASSFLRAYSVLVRTNRDPLSIVGEVRQAILSASPGAMVERPQALERLVLDSTYELNYAMAMLGGLAVLSLLLAVIGVYSVLSYSVRQRTSEIGVRMALGAERNAVLRLIVRQGVALTALGSLAGLALAAGLTRFLGSLLHGVEPWDPVVFCAVAALMLAVGAVAAYGPARRAAAVQPIEALRYE